MSKTLIIICDNEDLGQTLSTAYKFIRTNQESVPSTPTLAPSTQGTTEAIKGVSLDGSAGIASMGVSKGEESTPVKPTRKPAKRKTKAEKEAEAKAEATTEVKAEATTEVKAEVKAEVKSGNKSVADEVIEKLKAKNAATKNKREGVQEREPNSQGEGGVSASVAPPSSSNAEVEDPTLKAVKDNGYTVNNTFNDEDLYG